MIPGLYNPEFTQFEVPRQPKPQRCQQASMPALADCFRSGTRPRRRMLFIQRTDLMHKRVFVSVEVYCFRGAEFISV